MRVSKNKIIIIMILLCMCQFFCIFKTGNYIYKADFVNLLVIGISSILIITNKKLCIESKNRKYNIWILFSLIIWVLEVVISFVNYSQYGQGLITTLAASYGWLSVIVFFPLAYYQGKIYDENFLKTAIKKIGTLASILSILQVYLYKYGIVFLDISGSGIRDGLLRFGIAGSFISISSIIAFFDWVEERNKKNLMIFFINGCCLLYALRSRSEIMYLVFAIYLVLIMFEKRKNIKYTLLFLGMAIWGYAIYKGLINAFISELNNDAGVNMRFTSISYYWNQFIENPLLGMGIIHANSSSSYLLDLLRGPVYFGTTRYYYRDDVGLIGLVNEKGLVGLIWYISILAILIYQITRLYKFNKKKYTWLLATYIFILLCSINIVYVNNSRLITFILVCSLVNHYYLIEFSNKRL